MNDPYWEHAFEYWSKHEPIDTEDGTINLKQVHEWFKNLYNEPSTRLDSNIVRKYFNRQKKEKLNKEEFQTFIEELSVAVDVELDILGEKLKTLALLEAQKEKSSRHSTQKEFSSDQSNSNYEMDENTSDNVQENLEQKTNFHHAQYRINVNPGETRLIILQDDEIDDIRTINFFESANNSECSRIVELWDKTTNSEMGAPQEELEARPEGAQRKEYNSTHDMNNIFTMEGQTILTSSSLKFSDTTMHSSSTSSPITETDMDYLNDSNDSAAQINLEPASIENQENKEIEKRDYISKITSNVSESKPHKSQVKEQTLRPQDIPRVFKEEANAELYKIRSETYVSHKNLNVENSSQRNEMKSPEPSSSLTLEKEKEIIKLAQTREQKLEPTLSNVIEKDREISNRVEKNEAKAEPVLSLRLEREQEKMNLLGKTGQKPEPVSSITLQSEKEIKNLVESNDERSSITLESVKTVNNEQKLISSIMLHTKKEIISESISKGQPKPIDPSIKSEPFKSVDVKESESYGSNMELPESKDKQKEAKETVSKTKSKSFENDDYSKITVVSTDISLLPETATVPSQTEQSHFQPLNYKESAHHLYFTTDDRDTSDLNRRTENERDPQEEEKLISESSSFDKQSNEPEAPPSIEVTPGKSSDLEKSIESEKMGDKGRNDTKGDDSSEDDEYEALLEKFAKDPNNILTQKKLQGIVNVKVKNSLTLQGNPIPIKIDMPRPSQTNNPIRKKSGLRNFFSNFKKKMRKLIFSRHIRERDNQN